MIKITCTNSSETISATSLIRMTLEIQILKQVHILNYKFKFPNTSSHTAIILGLTGELLELLHVTPSLRWK